MKKIHIFFESESNPLLCGRLANPFNYRMIEFSEVQINKNEYCQYCRLAYEKLKDTGRLHIMNYLRQLRPLSILSKKNNG